MPDNINSHLYSIKETAGIIGQDYNTARRWIKGSGTTPPLVPTNAKTISQKGMLNIQPRIRISLCWVSVIKISIIVL